MEEGGHELLIAVDKEGDHGFKRGIEEQDRAVYFPLMSCAIWGEEEEDQALTGGSRVSA